MNFTNLELKTASATANTENFGKIAKLMTKEDLKVCYDEIMNTLGFGVQVESVKKELFEKVELIKQLATK